jgi:hypothetical protein
MSPGRQPVPRPRVLAGAMILLGLLAGLILTLESLRHPLPEGFDEDIPLAEDDSDPRDPIECEEDLPREGQERDADTPAGEAAAEEEARESLTAPATSNQLYDCPEIYDGRTVRYRGEVVGAVLERDGGAWVQLNDDIYADLRGPLPAHRDYRGGNAGVGAFVPTEVAEGIEWVGGPSTRGDVLDVVGTFRRVDPDSAEVAVIVVDAATFDRRGGRFARAELVDRRVLAIIAAALAIVVTVIERVVARRR